MLQRKTILSAFALLLTTFCLRAGAAELPEAFSRPWCAYQTAHFEFLTDLPRRRALANVRALERFRTMFMALFGGTNGGGHRANGLFPEHQRHAAPSQFKGFQETRTHSGVPVRMLVFRRPQHFFEVTGAAHFAGITVPALRAYQLLIGPAQESAITDTARHEYAHYLLRSHTDLHYPLWYEEGLATYLSAVSYKRNRAVLGHLEPGFRRRGGLSPEPSFEAVVQADSVADWPPERLVAFYEKAWLLVHFVRLGHQLGYPDYRPALARYLAQPERGFVEAFALPPAGMGDRIRDYLRQPRHPREHLVLPNAEKDDVPRRCLDDAEGRLELARSLVNLNPQLAADALKRHPVGEPDAEWLTAHSEALSAIDYAQALTAVEKALRLAPDHAGALAQLARLKVQGCPLSSDPNCMRNWAEAAALYRRALEADPQRYDSAYGLGMAYLHTGRAEQALGYLRLAHAQMPWAAEANFYLGEAYRMLGDPRAAEHLRKARGWAVNASWRARAEAALIRLDEAFSNVSGLPGVQAEDGRGP